MTSLHANAAPAARLTEADVAEIGRLMRERAGIRILPTQSSMLQSRLARRLRTSGLAQFSDYLALIRSDAGADELQQMIAAVTTNVTQFFREKHHFDLFASIILPKLMERARGGGRVRIWSAGGSSGQEAYSIALTIAAAAPDFAQCDIRLLSTDINQKMIAQGRRAIYDDDAISAIPDGLRARFLLRVPDGWRFTEDIRNLVRFRELNLHDDWPMKGNFDVIFCRNVAIYFDIDAQERLWTRLVETLTPNGWLLVGHSERVTGPAAALVESAGVTAYRRPPRNDARGAAS